MNNNCLEFVDVVNFFKVNSSLNSASTRKEISDSKNDHFNNVLQSVRKREKTMSKHGDVNKVNNSQTDNNGNNIENNKVKNYDESTKSKESNCANRSKKTTKKEIPLDDENKLEPTLEFLTKLNEFLEDLFNSSQINMEDFKFEGTSVNQEDDLIKIFNELMGYLNNNFSDVKKEQLEEIKELLTETLNNSLPIDSKDLIETVERLFSLTKDKNIVNTGSEDDSLNTSNLGAFYEINSTAPKNTPINQDKNLGEIVYETYHTDKSNDKLENNLENSADEEGLNQSDEFKLIYNTFNNKTDNIAEGNRFVDEYGRLDLNQYNLDNRDVESLLKEVTQKTKFVLKEKGSEVQIQLKPESLGKMVIKMTLEQGEMRAKALVDNTQAKQLIDNNLIQLKETLKEQGIEVKTFEVFVGKDPNFSNRDRKNWGGKSKLKLTKASVEEYDDVNSYYLNTFDNVPNNMLVYTTNFDIKA